MDSWSFAKDFGLGDERSSKNTVGGLVSGSNCDVQTRSGFIKNWGQPWGRRAFPDLGFAPSCFVVVLLCFFFPHY